MKQIVPTVIQNLPGNPRNGKTRMQWLFTILVNTTILSYGIQISWPASVAKVLQSDESPTGSALSALDISWLASSPNLAATVSIPVWTFIVDHFGRKPCMIINAVLQFVGWLIIYFARNMTTLMVSRIIGGIASGGCVYSMSIYVKEISQDDSRGTLGLVMSNSRHLGILLIYLMGYYFEYYTILYIVLAVAFIGVLTILTVPESPTYYVKIGQFETAASTIAYLRNLKVDDEVVISTLDSIKAEDEAFKSIPNITFIGIFKQKAWCKGFIIMILLMFCNGLNGGLAIVNLVPSVLHTARVSVNPELQSLSISVFMIIGSFLSTVIIERLGRKLILVMSFLLALLAFGALAMIVIIQQNGGHVPQLVAVVAIAVPVFSYAGAVASLPFIIMAEMFNFQIRAKVMGCLIMLGWTCSFVQILMFEPMSTAFGPQVSYIFFAVVNLCGILVSLVLLPETKRKSVEQIELELENIWKR